MSQVLITRSKLDDLAIAVSGKSGAAMPLTIAQMQSAIEGLSVGGYVPSDATLAASATETLNLSSDTSYDSWTPTTTNTSIKSAGTARAACNVTLTDSETTDYALMGVCALHTIIAYPEGTAYAKGYSMHKTIYGIAHYAPVQNFGGYEDANYGFTWYGAYGRQIYYSSASATSLYNATSYGLGMTGVTWGASSVTSTSTRTVGFTRPAVYARCHSTYFSTAAAAAVDSANTVIKCDYRIYKFPKAESPLYHFFDATSGAIWT